ncbi:hypothetical protein NPIL_174681 [Nephila pilipes]|uniref:Uncharacterized protein n=1 Tax=Nephila pilipes TaxID=299642 RepID=A0A8X6NC13_NEPPI|nr:hypothetical protein NPIL_174681 [Nephila pilipes]
MRQGGKIRPAFSPGRSQTTSLSVLDTTFWRRANDDLDPKLAPGCQKLSAFTHYQLHRALSSVYQSASGYQVLGSFDQILGYLMTPGVQQNRFLVANGRDNAAAESGKRGSLKTCLRLYVVSVETCHICQVTSEG